MVDPYAELEHLRKLAQANPNRRFDKLMKIIRRTAFLEMAWMKIRANKGSRTPGVDGQIKDDIDQNWDIIHDLAQELTEHRYLPQPVRRVYIPKGKHDKRPLGIPTLRDRIVQAAVMLLLEAIYEPIFRNCSHGFRPGRSTITALRQVATAYRAGATWIIEGDLQKCFDTLPHKVILNCLRKRIKDERFIDLIRRMLQSGIMEDSRYTPTYSGAPQGGIVSPILMNVVLHEFDCWMEDHWRANPPAQTSKQREARRNPDYVRLKSQLYRWRAKLDRRAPMGHDNPEDLKRKIKEAIEQRKSVPTFLPRQALFFQRYADDYVVILCNYSKEDACCLKQAMAEWLQHTLGLIQHPEKTHITHWRDCYRFLGYHLRGQRNRKGSRWLRLTIPPEAERKLKQQVKRLCRWTQIPETDLFMNVNALLRGWTQYYRYAHNASRRFAYLTTVVFWLTAHYLGRKHRRSIKQVMQKYYAVDPKTGKRALFITRPDNDARLFIWNKPPQRLSLWTSHTHLTSDIPPQMFHAWTSGHSYEQKLALRQKADNCCQHCGEPSSHLIVHHPNRLSKHSKHKRGMANVIQSAQTQQAKLLCPDCHLLHHHGNWRT